MRIAQTRIIGFSFFLPNKTLTILNVSRKNRLTLFERKN